MEKQVKKILIRTYETQNSALARSLFRKYNDENLPNYFATMAKKKGSNNFICYVVNIYSIKRI